MLWLKQIIQSEKMKITALFIASGTALWVGFLLLASARWHLRWSADSSVGIQRNHSRATPRIGGIAILAGVIAGWAAVNGAQHTLLGHLLLAGLPAFAFGLAEDLSKRVSVRARFLATLSCGVFAYVFTGYSITDVQVPGLDWLLGFTLISVAFTAFAVAGVANAINLIDGMNGLAGGTVIIMLCGLALLAQSLGDPALMQTCLLLGAATVGFMLLNWPLGKLFLGDGGAYFLGFGVAWVCVLLLWRHPQVSAWAPLLVCCLPVLEVLFSIQRRRARGQRIDAPDRLHLHSLVKRRLARWLLPHGSRLQRNSLTGAILCGTGLLPAAIALYCYDSTPALMLGLLLCAFLYRAAYARLTQFRWCFWALVERSMAEALA